MNTIENTRDYIPESETEKVNTSPKNIKWARRIEKRELPKPKGEQQKVGLRYERKVVRTLQKSGFDLEHNPWFEYWTRWEKRSKLGIVRVCCPDTVIYELCRNRVIVIEIKLTFKLEALKKLKEVYCPVVSNATGLEAKPLVIYKNAVLGLQVPYRDFYQAVDGSFPVYQWLGIGPII